MFDELKPYNSGYLKVSDIHSIYYEECGNKDGIPIVFVHGGPGGVIESLPRKFFNKDKYRVIIFDQRGSGRSKPFVELRENTTFDLVEDMEKLRKLLGIDKWILFGGSWGTTLSLVYAINHPNKVLGMILRGIFLARKSDLWWLYEGGAAYFYPEEFEKYISILTDDEKKNIIASYMKYLSSDDKEIVKKYAKNWNDWESSIVRLYPRKLEAEVTDYDIAIARLECHYFYNNSFLPQDNYILNNIDKIADIRTLICHGRYDVDCRPSGAYELKSKMNNCELHIVEAAGHSSMEPEIAKKLIEFTEIW
ncbi:prolyl aminopeptidase [Oceanivirga miroungae]|uniref:Proline iminopeptidase n=1 Tax=Oceanivirga miroungae TaxID=1130046 RepID=A0A6I8MEL7_9FUSO|nr:prolyl aminopeptidase [Oceanivirga miroungae]VWL85668.1 Proline iminopeptidase [Oceanivirga miroungae]